MELKELLLKVKEYLPDDKLPLIEEAYHFAAKAHEGQRRLSGEPYLEHPVYTASIVADLRLDAAGVAAALLHDVHEDCGVSLEELEKRFGPEVAKLVSGTSKLSRATQQAEESRKARQGSEAAATQAENLRKMLMAMAEDVRVVLIKLADRLHNMRTLAALPSHRRRLIAQETLEIYAPLASHLGIWEIKWQLEDLAFRHLKPDEYRQVSHLVATRRAAREKYIEQVNQVLKEELQKAGVKAEVVGRPKHLYSIYQKMQRYAAQGKEFGDIHDLLALRLLVNEVADCYAALGVVHNLWHPLPNQFDDYIANSKQNMYQSLHTTVIGPGGSPLEIQIRTYEMHHFAEYGIAAHWRYKEGATKKDSHFEEKIAWLRQLLEWQKEVAGAEDFVESVKSDLFRDQVFVYTPKGDIKELPTGATPLDFAYLIHTELGHRCVGAKVNGKLVPLNYQVQNGDTVEIIRSKTPRGPSLDWLNPDLGYVNTSHGREKVRQWFRHLERTENIGQGRELVDKELRRLGINPGDQPEIFRLLKYDTMDDFLAAVGSGSVTVNQIAAKLAAQQEPPPEIAPTAARAAGIPSVEVLGVGDLLTHISRCCHPVPGDDIIGFVTRSRGVTIHRRDCYNMAHEDERERLVKVSWGQTGQIYSVEARIEAWDRVGLLRDISAVVSEEKVNMTAVNTVSHSDQTATIRLTLEITGLGQLSRIFSRMQGIKGVVSVAREMAGKKAETSA